MVGQTMKQQGVKVEVTPKYMCVKEAVFPFTKFLGVDPVLGPEMRSTGEVMGVGASFGEALYKAELGAGDRLPEKGTAFISVRDVDKARAVSVATHLRDQGFNIVATRGTAALLQHAAIPCRVVNKVSEGRPNVVDMIKNGDVQLVIATADESRTRSATRARSARRRLRSSALCTTRRFRALPPRLKARSTRRMSRSAACRNFTR